jgi:hypothetical protein
MKIDGVSSTQVTPKEGVFEVALTLGHTPLWGVRVWRCDGKILLAYGFRV